MKKYFEEILRYTAYLFASWFISALVCTGAGLIFIFFFAERPGILSNILSILLNQLSLILPFVILYIAAHRVGYERNNTYEKNPKLVKELLIPIIISLLIFLTVDIKAWNFWFSSSISGILLRIFTNVHEMNLGEFTTDYLLENYYWLLILSTFLQSILQAFVMILGFYMGYKKREKDRKETISNHNN